MNCQFMAVFLDCYKCNLFLNDLNYIFISVYKHFTYVHAYFIRGSNVGGVHFGTASVWTPKQHGNSGAGVPGTAPLPPPAGQWKGLQHHVKLLAWRKWNLYCNVVFNGGYMGKKIELWQWHCTETDIIMMIFSNNQSYFALFSESRWETYVSGAGIDCSGFVVWAPVDLKMMSTPTNTNTHSHTATQPLQQFTQIPTEQHLHVFWKVNTIFKTVKTSWTEVLCNVNMCNVNVTITHWFK